MNSLNMKHSLAKASGLFLVSMLAVATSHAQTTLFGGDVVGTSNVAFERWDNSMPIEVAFDTANQLSPSSTYTGNTFYGGYDITNSGTGAVRTYRLVSQVVYSDVDGSNDAIRLSVAVDGSNTGTFVGAISGAFVFEVPDTAYGNFTDFSTAYDLFKNSNYTGDPELRIVLGDTTGTSWFVSSSSGDDSGTSLSINPGTETWNTLNTSDFSIGAAATPSQIGYVGFYVNSPYDGTATSNHQLIRRMDVTELTYTAVPEPSSTAAAFGILALAALLYMRKRRQ